MEMFLFYETGQWPTQKTPIVFITTNVKPFMNLFSIVILLKKVQITDNLPILVTLIIFHAN